MPAVVALLVAAVVGDVLILTFGQIAGRGLSPAARRHVGQRVRLRPGALQDDDAHVHRARGRDSGCAPACSTSAPRASSRRADSAPRWSGSLLPAGLAGAALTLPVYILAAALGGGVVGAVPGALKARFGAHEVITTIMLNFIVLALLNYLIVVALQGRRTRCTRRRSTPARCRGSSDFVAAFHGSAANVVLFLALVAALVALVVSLPHAARLRAARDRPAAAGGGVRRRERRRRVVARDGAVRRASPESAA